MSSECQCSYASHRQDALLSSPPLKAEHKCPYRQDIEWPFDTEAVDSLSARPCRGSPRHRQGSSL